MTGNCLASVPVTCLDAVLVAAGRLALVSLSLLDLSQAWFVKIPSLWEPEGGKASRKPENTCL